MTTDDSNDGPQLAGPFAVAESLTWRLATEIVRRHPKDLWIVQTHPFDFYDCLTIRPLGAPMIAPGIDLNRLGTGARVGWLDKVRPGPPDGAEILRWSSAYYDDNPRTWVRDIEKRAGLDAPANVPASTPSSLALRWIAAFLRQQLGAHHRWSMHNTWIDGPIDDYFEGFDGAAQFARQFGPGGAAHVWLLSRGDLPAEVAVCADGTLHRRGRQPTDLMEFYRGLGSSLLKLLAATAADLLD